jgi:DNA-binding LytR/AlgR family response regulator
MRCYILDNYTSVKIISQYISTFKDLKLIGSSSSTLDAYSEIINLTPDIVFVNSSLPKLNLEKLDFVTSFIYTADAPHFAAEAFENNAVDYLLKPFTLERFSKCIAKIRQKQEELKESLIKDRSKNSDYFFVRNEARGNKVIRIKYDEIIYIEASQNYVTIHLENKKSHLIYLTMKEIEDFLPASKFVRVHKSYLINEDRISSIDGNKIVLDDLHTIVCGVSYRKDLFNKVSPKLITSKRRFDKVANEALEDDLTDKRSN